MTEPTSPEPTSPEPTSPEPTSAPRVTRGRRHLWAAGAGAVGLIAGLGLGATTLASASSPAPGPKGSADSAPHERLHLKAPLGSGLRLGHGPGGLVSAIDGDSLTLRTPVGSRTFALTSSTVFYEGKDKATASAVEVGEVVHVRVVDPQADKPVAAVVRVVPAHVGGWVTKVEGRTITVTDREGFTRRISTGSGTEFTRSGEASSLSAIKVGDLVMAIGSVADDGTTLEADRVATGLPKAGRLDGRMGGPFKGGLGERRLRLGGVPEDQPAA